MKLDGKTILITGASKGLGKELALEISTRNTKLALIARNKSLLEELKSEILKNNSECEIFAADLCSATEIENAIKYFHEKLGTIDILINNAGIGIFKPLEEIEIEEYDNMMNTNVRASFLVSKLLIPEMKQKKLGQIVFIASDVAKRTFKNGSVYCATKYAQDALASTLRKELRNYGIKVTVIYPGLIDTYFADTEQGEEYKNDWLKTNEITKSIVHLLEQPDNVVIDELMIHPLSQDY